MINQITDQGNYRWRPFDTKEDEGIYFVEQHNGMWVTHVDVIGTHKTIHSVRVPVSWLPGTFVKV